MSLKLYSDLGPAPADARSDVTALVLCAAWCGSCRGFLPVVEQVAERFSQVRWAWIDVEDAADALPSLDVETFPSLAVVADGAVRFLGPIAPDPGVMTRLVTAMSEAASVVEGEEAAELAALAARLP